MLPNPIKEQRRYVQRQRMKLRSLPKIRRRLDFMDADLSDSSNNSENENPHSPDIQKKAIPDYSTRKSPRLHSRPVTRGSRKEPPPKRVAVS